MDDDGRFDTTRTELMGRFWLANQLAQNRIEVAYPARDIGVDLIAYPPDLQWLAPIQLKVINGGPLRVEAKYLGKACALVYVLLGEPDGGPSSRQVTTAYTLTPEEAWELPARLGRKFDPDEHIAYGFGGLPSKLLEILEKEFRVEPGNWYIRLEEVSSLAQ